MVVRSTVISTLGTVPLRLGKGARTDGNKRMNRNHSNYRIIKIGQNTEKILGDLRKLAVTQTPGENHQLMLV